MYQIYALKYAERDTPACGFFYREHSHETITLHYFVWLILGGPHPVLLDTGFQEDDVERRGIRNYVRPSLMVERMGVKVADIPIALISHLHYDHWAGHRLFPASEFWIQKDEVAFWTGRFGRYDAFSQSQNVDALANLVPLTYAKRVRIVEGEVEVLPGLRVHRVGGHTAGQAGPTPRSSFPGRCISRTATEEFSNASIRACARGSITRGAARART